MNIRCFYCLLLLFLTASCSPEGSIKPSSQLYDVDFDAAMGMDVLGEGFINRYPADRQFYHYCKALWQQRRPKECSVSSTPPIPLMIHQIWLSDEPLPKKCLKYQQSWKDFHPGWKYKLWLSKDLETLPSHIKQAILQASNIEKKEELLRAYILDVCGGACVDLFSECLSSLATVHSTYDLYLHILPPLAKHHHGRRICVSRTFLGASAEHPIIKAWRKELFEAQIDDPHLLQNVIERYNEQQPSSFIIFPPTYAFPIRGKWLVQFEKKRKRSVWDSCTGLWNPTPLFSTLQQESFAVSHVGEFYK